MTGFCMKHNTRLKRVKHDNPDLCKAIKMAQRALKHSIDDFAGLEISSHKKMYKAPGNGRK